MLPAQVHLVHQRAGQSLRYIRAARKEGMQCGRQSSTTAKILPAANDDERARLG